MLLNLKNNISVNSPCSRELSTDGLTKYKGPTTRAKAMELAKEDEKGEFVESEIVCKNDH